MLFRSMQMYPFLFAHIKRPKLEHLVKVGFCNLASDLAYRGCYGLKLDESQNRTHRLLGVGAEDVDFLWKLDVDQAALKIFQGYCERNLKDRQRLLAWQWEWKVERDIDTTLDYMTVHKLIRYLDAQWSFLQYRLTEYKARRYRSMQDIATEYKDYLDMCRRARLRHEKQLRSVSQGSPESPRQGSAPRQDQGRQPAPPGF